MYLFKIMHLNLFGLKNALFTCLDFQANCKYKYVV